MDFKILKRDAQRIAPKIDSGASYIQAYFEFIRYFRDVTFIEKQHLFIGAHFVYGWMPRMLNLHTDNLEEVLKILNKVKNQEKLGAQEIGVLNNCINRSMVGTSKLLHFINPQVYAIWDSRVLNYCRSRFDKKWVIGSPTDYQEYLDGIRNIVNTSGYDDIHKLIEDRCGYKIEPTRAIEMIMYESERDGLGESVK